MPSYGSAQSTGSQPTAASSAFALEKWRHPKNPFDALSGDGCAYVSTWWRVASTTAPFCCA